MRMDAPDLGAKKRHPVNDAPRTLEQRAATAAERFSTEPHRDGLHLHSEVGGSATMPLNALLLLFSYKQ